jgi:uncharacterized membrane protein
MMVSSSNTDIYIALLIIFIISSILLFPKARQTKITVEILEIHWIEEWAKKHPVNIPNQNKK